MSPEWKVVLSCFIFNISLVSAASIIGLGCLITLHRKTHSQQTLPCFNLFLYAVAIGFSAIITTLFFLALSGWLIKVVIFTTLILFVTIAGIYLATQRHFFQHYVTTQYKENNQKTLYAISLYGTIIIALFSLLSNVYMTGFSDGTSYHLPYAQFYLDHRGLATNINLRYPYQTHNGNLLYSFALTYADSVYCQTLNTLFGVLTALIIFSFSVEAGIYPPLAMVAAASFLNLGAFIYLTVCADVDLFSVFFITASIYAITIWKKNQSQMISFYVSAICLGIAMGTKYLSTLFTIPLAAFILYNSRSIRPLFTYAAVTALFGLWWYIRSYLLIGNPVHPFATGIFGYSLWNEADIIIQNKDLASGVIEKNIMNFITLPQQFSKEPFSLTGMQYWLYAFYIAPLFWRRLSIISRALMWFTWPLLLFWFYSTQIWRYIVPLAPLIIIISFDLAQILLNLVGTLIPKKNQAVATWESIQPVVIGLTLSFILQQSTLYIKQLRHVSQWVITPGTQDVLFKKINLEYQLIDIANQYFNKNKNVFLFDFFDKIYFLKANAIGDHFGPNRVRDIISMVVAASNETDTKRPALNALKDQFAERHIDGFIIDNRIAYNQQLLDQHFERLYNNSAGAIYRIRHP